MIFWKQAIFGVDPEHSGILVISIGTILFNLETQTQIQQLKYLVVHIYRLKGFSACLFFVSCGK